MSVSASIDIKLSEIKRTQISATEIIEVLVSSGWNLFHGEYLSYLPLGDKDDFDWQDKKDMSWNALTKIIEAKEQAKEIVGIMMTWENTKIGGDFLFWPPKTSYCNTFSLSTNNNRQVISLTNDYNITDFQWYLPKLLIPLNKAFTIESFKLDHYR